jgi:hypothetical protein
MDLVMPNSSGTAALALPAGTIRRIDLHLLLRH